MDSFSVFFRRENLDSEIQNAILATEASVYSRAPGEFFVSRQDGMLWLDSYVVADLPSREYWPIPKGDVGRILSIAVSRDEESSSLAVEVAHRLAIDLGGIVSWDGNEYTIKPIHRSLRAERC